ncbi:MAG: HU family DNA-binding protein [Pseudomonadota bacterium]
MNLSDLVIRISFFSGMSIRQTEKIVDCILSDMSNTLAAGQRIEIRGFGTFDLSLRPARIARNPRTGEKFSTIGKYFPAFKAGKYLKEKLSYPSKHDQMLAITKDAATLKQSIRILTALNNVIQAPSA